MSIRFLFRYCLQILCFCFQHFLLFILLLCYFNSEGGIKLQNSTLKVKTTQTRQVVDLTDPVNRRIAKSQVEEGICLLFIQHTTAALTVGEVGEGTEDDLLDVLREMIPKMRFRHAHDPAHTPAHMIASILGPSLALPVAGGRLALGTWQSILLIELDGPRERTIHVQLLK